MNNEIKKANDTESRENTKQFIKNSGMDRKDNKIKYDLYIRYNKKGGISHINNIPILDYPIDFQLYILRGF